MPPPGRPAYVRLMPEHSGDRPGWNWGAGIALGIALGVSMGIATSSWILGIALGVALGTALAAAMRPHGGQDEGEGTPGP